jgi:hypothetical protein
MSAPKGSKTTPQQRRSNANAPLPVPVTPRALPELREEAAKFDVDLAAFARALDPYKECGGRADITDTEVALVRRVGSELDALRARWRAINQPATDEQIASEMLRLTTTMPHASNINPNNLNETLCEDVEELKPAHFALVRGCHAVRTKYNFLNISDLVEEIRETQRNARRYSDALEDFNLADFEADLRKQIADNEAMALEWAAERKRGKIAKRRQLEAERKFEREKEKLRRKWFADSEESESDDGASP